MVHRTVCPEICVGADRAIALSGEVSHSWSLHHTVATVADHTYLTDSVPYYCTWLMSLAVCVCDIKIYVAPILLLKVFTHSHTPRGWQAQRAGIVLFGVLLLQPASDTAQVGQVHGVRRLPALVGQIACLPRFALLTLLQERRCTERLLTCATYVFLT